MGSCLSCLEITFTMLLLCALACATLQGSYLFGSYLDVHIGLMSSKDMAAGDVGGDGDGRVVQTGLEDWRPGRH